MARFIAENKDNFKKKGITKDIITQVINTFKKDYLQCVDVAKELQGKSNIETYENIFNYVLKHVEYVADPQGVQWIKTPARLITDGKGDCKSMAIFIASCLRCLGIDAYFRFVSFGKSKTPTHVYIVTYDNIIIDPVERVNGQPKFNYAQEYNTKIEIMNTTNIYELRGIGSNETTTIDYTPYTGAKSFLENSIAENYLCSEIDYLTTLLTIEPTAENFNQCDAMALSLYLLQNGYDNEKGGLILQKMKDEGHFNYLSINEKERVVHLDKLFETARNVDILDFKIGADTEVAIWYNDILKQNVIEGRNQEGIEEYEKLVGENKIGITTKQKNELIAKMKESGWGFCYILANPMWIVKQSEKYPEMQRKLQNENGLFMQWYTSLTKYFTQQTILNYLKDGFIKQTNQTPENYILAGIKKGELPSAPNIGIAASVVAAIIAAVAAVVTTVLNMIIALIQKSMQSPTNYPNDIPPNNDDYLSAEDLKGDSGSGSGTTDEKKSSLLPILLIGGLIFLTKNNEYER
ncbi:MAG: transglutaminase-like domain-containing protein [Prevotellaceae bacterium]|jgi:hypothetical protein|nr:transglutaminase-like domain-containing protein [Prevotellaceae bacterium]